MATKLSELPDKVTPILTDEVAGLDMAVPATPVTSKMTLDSILDLLAAKNAKMLSADINTTGIQDYLVGRITYDPDSKTNVSDTGISGVRVQIGQELMYLVFNDSGAQIDNGKAVYPVGIDATNNLLSVDLADSSTFISSAQVLGLATHDIGDGEIGLVTYFGQVRDFDTTGIGAGLAYLGTDGDIVTTKPVYPAARIAIGSVLSSHATEGIFQVITNFLPRATLFRSYSLASTGISADTHYEAGFYDWETSDANLDEGNTSIAYGYSTASKAAHASIVPSGPGSVIGGVIGLRVVGIEDSEIGPQVAAQIGIITEDITTLEADTYYETTEKFSGEITFELYVISGTPTVYSLDFNYGFSKYEDFANRDFTVTSFEAKWRGGANSALDVSLMHHKTTGWTYAATGFVPGNGYICRKSIDQVLAATVADNGDGAYKRVSLDTFIEGSGSEGIVIEVITGAPNTLQSLDLHIESLSEELDY